MAQTNNVEHNTLIEVITTYFGNHPLVGFVIAAVNVAGGTAIKVAQESAEIPTIVMQLFQIGAWTAGIVAGTMTAYGVWKTHHGKKKK